MKKSLQTIGVFALVATLAACGGNGKDEGKSESSKKPSAKSTAVVKQVTPDGKTLPSIKNPKGAKDDVKIGKCDTKAGEQKVEGEITNSSDKATDYLVDLAWVGPKNKVVGEGFFVAKGLKPKETKKFTITAKVGPKASKCVPLVTRGKVA